MDENIFETQVETATPQAEEVQLDTPAESVEDTTQQTEQQTPEPPQLPSLKVKFNHEEREIPYEEAVQLTQKGLNYDKLQEKLNTLQSNPALSFVEQQAKMYGLTTEQYIQAVNQQQEQARLDELIQKNIPEDLAKEILANRQFRSQWEQQQAEQQSKQKVEEDYKAFLNAFPDAKPEEIPAEVWQQVEQGASLVDAYTRHENQQLKARLKVLEQNQLNQQKAPVNGVTTHGGSEPAKEDPFLAGFHSI